MDIGILQLRGFLSAINGGEIVPICYSLGIVNSSSYKPVIVEGGIPGYKVVCAMELSAPLREGGHLPRTYLGT